MQNAQGWPPDYQADVALLVELFLLDPATCSSCDVEAVIVLSSRLISIGRYEDLINEHTSKMTQCSFACRSYYH